jgi:biopolymer transport protein ExbD
MKSGRKLKKPEKLNLVPILDSVFIFIFFLLMSAQFVEVYEIGSSLPMTKEATEDKEDKDPLNLIVEINQENIVVKTGLRKPASRSFASSEVDKLNEYLSELKENHPKENTIIIKSDPKIKFQNLVSVIDKTQTGKDGKKKLFEQIVFGNSGDAK